MSLWEVGSRMGSHLGNWNDRVHADRSAPLAGQPKRWKRLDRIAGWFYVLPDSHGRRPRGTVTPSFSTVGYRPQVVRGTKAQIQRIQFVTNCAITLLETEDQ